MLNATRFHLTVNKKHLQHYMKVFWHKCNWLENLLSANLVKCHQPGDVKSSDAVCCLN